MFISPYFLGTAKIQFKVLFASEFCGYFAGKVIADSAMV
jgi:hypothetical protein